MPLDLSLTALTDYALAVQSLAHAVAIGRAIGPETRVTGWLWCLALAAATVAASVGGTYHGLETRVEPFTAMVLWSVTMFSIGSSVAFITAAVHAAHVRRGDGTVLWLGRAIAVTLVGALVQQGVLGSPAAWGPNPTYHLIQMVGVYCVYRCARTTRDRYST